MSCAVSPLPTLPDISPLSVEPPALPPFAGDLTICCKLVAFNWTPVIPLPAIVLTSSVMAVINAQIAIVNTWIDVLQVPCPRDG